MPFRADRLAWCPDRFGRQPAAQARAGFGWAGILVGRSKEMMVRSVTRRSWSLGALALVGLGVSSALWAQTLAPSAIGVVVMHGKGGLPTKHVADLASHLSREGFRVANLEMPWSGHRAYDVDAAAAQQEVLAALDTLKQQGAQAVFVVGHSQGGVFAFAMGSRLPVSGVIAIAPGGNVASSIYREKLAEPLARAQQAVAQGQGDVPMPFADYESSRGTFPIQTTPRVYLSWFDAAGLMNQTAAMKQLPADLPVLLVAPTGDYPGLLRVKPEVVAQLPRNARTRVLEPAASHLNAPSAAKADIAAWMREVASTRSQ